MHTSLTTKTNVILSILWFAIAAAITILSSESMWAPIAVGAYLGILAGAAAAPRLAGIRRVAGSRQERA